jgi:large subunit ribosomal protein L21
MYAVIETGGKQYRVQKGERLRIEKLEVESGTTVNFPVLLVSDGSQVKVGSPHVAGAAVTATVKGEEKGEKLTIFKYRRRKGYRRKTGHRQQYTSVQIDDIKA